MTFSEPLALVRRVAREAGRRFAAQDKLDEPDDVFHLELDEIARGLAEISTGGEALSDFRPLVARRKAERAWAEAHPGPPSYGRNFGRPPFHALPPAARFANEALLWFVEQMFAETESAGRQADALRLTGIPASKAATGDRPASS